MLLHKTVQLFNITDYDMGNETIKDVCHIDMSGNCTGTHLMKMMT